MWLSNSSCRRNEVFSCNYFRGGAHDKFGIDILHGVGVTSFSDNPPSATRNSFC